MLQKLIIQNYAIIDRLEVNWDSHLNIITGETGAGKSILMGALGLILGERADTSVLLNNSLKCVVEGHFTLSTGSSVHQFLAENEIDTGDDLIIRREVSAQGRSRAFINDTPVQLTALKQVTSGLVDMHQQFDTLELGDDEFQREVLDALAAHAPLLLQYRQVFQDYIQRLREWKQLEEEQAQASRERDYHQFILDELEQASFRENEIEELESEMKVLTHAGKIRTILEGSQHILSEADPSVIAQLKSVAQQLDQLASIFAPAGELAQRLKSSLLELQDIDAEISHQAGKVNTDERRMESVNERLNLGFRLLKKHGFQTTNDLLELKETLELKLDHTRELGDQIEKKKLEAEKLKAEATKLALTITDNRKKQLPGFIKKVESLLARVGMPNAKLKVDIRQKELNPTGADDIEFLFDANKSGRFEPLRKVASGGELSRLMLCVKSLIAHAVQMPTLIFDEIDTGISGEAARQAGTILRELADSHQVLVITHQPQIAARAHRHFHVTKEENNGKVLTRIRILPEEERIVIIAQMLSGEKPSVVALQNAREMVENSN